MYRAWFGLARRPFDKTPDPQAMLYTPGHTEALARLEQAAEERDIVVVVGGIGCGKTTLIRALLDRLPDSVVPVVLVHPTLAPLQLLRQIARALGIDPVPSQAADLIDAIHQQLFEMHQQGRLPYLIVDEAHLLRCPEGFEQLRLLTNFQLDDLSLLALALLGQPELRDRLAQPELAAFRQRMGYFYELPALDAEAVGAYVLSRWTYAGGHREQIAQDVPTLLHALTAGVPRRINQIMHNACLAAFARDSETVDVRDVQDAAHELMVVA